MSKWHFFFPLDRLAHDPYDVVGWHLFLMLPQWCLALPLMTRQHAQGNVGLTQVFFNRWLGKPIGGVLFVGPSFHDKFKFSVFSPWSSNSWHILCSLVFENAGEYSNTSYILAPFSLTPTSSYATLFLTALHFKLNGFFLLFLKDYELN
jgi:hypothetical protein